MTNVSSKDSANYFVFMNMFYNSALKCIIKFVLQEVVLLTLNGFGYITKLNKLCFNYLGVYQL